MHLSVIIPTFNRVNLLPRAIKSVIEQSYWRDHGLKLNRDYEIIVIDDGSDDTTAAFL